MQRGVEGLFSNSSGCVTAHNRGTEGAWLGKGEGQWQGQQSYAKC